MLSKISAEQNCIAGAKTSRKEMPFCKTAAVNTYPPSLLSLINHPSKPNRNIRFGNAPAR